MHITDPNRAPITTYQAAAAQRDARPGRIRRLILVGAAVLAVIPAGQFVEYVARKTAATVEMAERCAGTPECFTPMKSEVASGDANARRKATQ